MEESPLIPENEVGIQTNTESSAEFDTIEKADSFFNIVKSRLMHVNQWHNLAGKATADFKVTDEKGNEVERAVKQGDYLKINIHAPGLISGEGFDWVKVEAIEERDDFSAILVRPAPNPQNTQQDVAHFFDESATSSFVVKKEGNKVIAGIYGRNEKPNTGIENTRDKIRNAAIATGAIAGFSKIQWKSLVNGFIEPVR
jgi:hypothetical protein